MPELKDFVRHRAWRSGVHPLRVWGEDDRGFLAESGAGKRPGGRRRRRRDEEADRVVPGVDFDEVAVLVGSKSGAIADNVKTRQVDQRHLVPSGAAGGGGAGGIFVRLRDKADEVLRIQMGVGFGVRGGHVPANAGV